MSHTAPSPNLNYIRKLYAPQDALLESIDSMLADLGKQINIGAEEGKLLQLIMTLKGVRSVVEIGTLAGYSTLWMARALPEGGHIYTIERDAEHAKLARRSFDRSEVRSRTTALEGDALALLPKLAEHGPFDMVFIDADKPGYNAYLDWAEQHVRKEGLIVADNTLLFGAAALDSPPPGTAPSTWQGMRRFNERLADSARYFSMMIPTQEGLSVAIKKF